MLFRRLLRKNSGVPRSELRRATRVSPSVVEAMEQSRRVDAVLNNRRALFVLVVLEFMLDFQAALVKADSLCQALISPLGYACHDYSVKTADGFLLGMYNIPYGRAGPSAILGRPVLLFHGFQGGGDNFFWNAPEESLGTVLADAGYDVWIGNNRNVQWSHGHIKYTYNDSQYWDWTWDELGAMDVTSSIQFVHDKRGQNIFYVGHSQGTLSLFATLTSTPELRAQVTSQLRAAVALAPFTYNANVKAPLQRQILSSYMDVIPPLLGIGPIDATGIVDFVCNQSVANCKNLIDGLLGQDNYRNASRLDFYLKFFPQVTSSKNYNHLGQTMRSGLFQMYDRGWMENMVKYGQLSPPLYDLSAFPSNLPFQVFTGGIDELADPTDTQHFLSSLPSNVNMEVLHFADYGHLDFMIGVKAYIDIYPRILTFLSSH